MYERKDSYYRRAKGAGLRSRAAFKLEEVAKRLIRPGARVLDLGAWPGGWLQIAAERTGPGGRVVGVDLKELRPLGFDHVVLVQGDVSAPEVRSQLHEALGGRADVVLSDMAPKLTGIRDRDNAQAELLQELAFDTARALLCRGGGFVCKVFMGPGYKPFVESVRERFAAVRATRPDSTRKHSSELYLVARDFRV